MNKYVNNVPVKINKDLPGGHNFARCQQKIQQTKLNSLTKHSFYIHKQESISNKLVYGIPMPGFQK
jgi:hypothetical protein